MIHFTHVCLTTIVVIPPIPSHPSILPSLHPFLSAPPPLIHLQIKVDQMSPLEITVPSKLLTFMAHGGIRIPSWLLESEVRRVSRWLMWVSQANAAQSGLKPKLQHLSGVKGVCCASTHLLWVYQIVGPAWFVPGGDIQMHVYIYTHTHAHTHMHNHELPDRMPNISCISKSLPQHTYAQFFLADDVSGTREHFSRM